MGLVMAAVACGGGKKGTAKVDDPSGIKNRSGEVVSKKAAQGFKRALDAFVTQDKAGTWSNAECKSVADQFLAASKEQESAGGNPLPEAFYNAGLAYQRCGDDANAKAQFEKAKSLDDNFHRSRAQLALYQYKESGNVDQAIQELDQIIRDAKFQNVSGLVGLAALQMQRGGKQGGPGCDDDLSCAKLNLQRALAIDDSFMPAFNQLAVYYLEQARGETGNERRGLIVSGSKKKRINKQRLDLAALVASQAQEKNPNYAPIHNTTGLILVELENYNGAVKAFGRARQLNPKFFEAQMNYGAVNLSFRAFQEAEKAYRAALALQPETYEAHLGLALALRGQINDQNFEKYVAEAQKHLDAAKKVESGRPEAFYNEAILAQEFRAKKAQGEQAQIEQFQKAKSQYQSFVSKAEGNQEFKDAVKVSKNRISDIEDTIEFLKEGIELAKQEAAESAKQQKDEAASAGGGEGDEASGAKEQQ